MKIAVCLRAGAPRPWLYFLDWRRMRNGDGTLTYPACDGGGCIMKRFVLAAVAVLGLCPAAWAQGFYGPRPTPQGIDPLFARPSFFFGAGGPRRSFFFGFGRDPYVSPFFADPFARRRPRVIRQLSNGCFLVVDRFGQLRVICPEFPAY